MANEVLDNRAKKKIQACKSLVILEFVYLLTDSLCKTGEICASVRAQHYKSKIVCCISGPCSCGLI